MRLEEVACRGKARYLSRKAAKAASKKVARMQHIKGLHPYTCDFCGCIHLGHRAGGATYQRYSAVDDPQRRV